MPIYSDTESDEDPEHNNEDTEGIQPISPRQIKIYKSYNPGGRRSSMANLSNAIKELMKREIEPSFIPNQQNTKPDNPDNPDTPDTPDKPDKSDKPGSPQNIDHAKFLINQRRGSMLKYDPNSLEAFQRTGNAAMYTQEAIDERSSMQHHPLIEEKYVLWWRTVLELYDHDNDEMLNFEEYLPFYGHLHAVMLKGTAGLDEQDEQWKVNAKEDWDRDVATPDPTQPAKRGMNFKHFKNSIHELVDLWTVSVAVEEYIEFLDYTLTRLVEIAPQTKANFWTRAVQRLKLPAFLLKSANNLSQNTSTDELLEVFPPDIRQMLTSGIFNQSMLAELRMEFMNVANEQGEVDEKGFVTAMRRLGYLKTNREDEGRDKGIEDQKDVLGDDPKDQEVTQNQQGTARTTEETEEAEEAEETETEA